MSDDQSPTLERVIAALYEEASARGYTSLPARVARFDKVRQVIDAAPTVLDTFINESGDRQVESIALVTEVPIAYYGAVGFRIVMPLAVGSLVTLIMTSVALDRWLSTGEDGLDPIEERRNHLTDAIAFPGLHTFDNVPTEVVDGAMVIYCPELRLGGSDATADAARNADLTALKNALLHSSVLAGIASASVDGGSVFSAELTARLVGWPTPSIVKIK